MADLIYRDALLQDMTKRSDGISDWHVFDVINEQPAVNRWIPCSERLPELKRDHESECVLCYCDTGVYAFSTFQENMLGQVGFSCEKANGFRERAGNVIAWMPLPEPPEQDGDSP
jgi:hypothetical protein